MISSSTAIMIIMVGVFLCFVTWMIYMLLNFIDTVKLNKIRRNYEKEHRGEPEQPAPKPQNDFRRDRPDDEPEQRTANPEPSPDPVVESKGGFILQDEPAISVGRDKPEPVSPKPNKKSLRGLFKRRTNNPKP